MLSALLLFVPPQVTRNNKSAVLFGLITGVWPRTYSSGTLFNRITALNGFPRRKKRLRLHLHLPPPPPAAPRPTDCSAPSNANISQNAATNPHQSPRTTNPHQSPFWGLARAFAGYHFCSLRMYHNIASAPTYTEFKACAHPLGDSLGLLPSFQLVRNGPATSTSAHCGCPGQRGQPS